MKKNNVIIFFVQSITGDYAIVKSVFFLALFCFFLFVSFVFDFHFILQNHIEKKKKEQRRVIRYNLSSYTLYTWNLSFSCSFFLLLCIFYLSAKTVVIIMCFTNEKREREKKIEIKKELYTIFCFIMCGLLKRLRLIISIPIANVN